VTWMAQILYGQVELTTGGSPLDALIRNQASQHPPLREQPRSTAPRPRKNRPYGTGKSNNFRSVPCSRTY
jgi:hypothetical protein